MPDAGATVNGRKPYPGGNKVTKAGVAGSETAHRPEASQVANLHGKTTTDGQHTAKPGESKPDLEASAKATAQTTGTTAEAQKGKRAAEVFYPPKKVD